ncbi:glycosyl hydrolase family 18 protein [Cysteiniphilum litorale]|uniref:glycosyl hydrolase family 18 protein n=1 Tax=Cysteiniphilum litorale TaxID=2056700 RepID=UPI003F883AEB
MKLKKVISYLAGSSVFIGAGAYANISKHIDMANQWYQSVELQNTAAETLGYHLGDSITVITPTGTYVGSSWGALTLQNCDPKFLDDKTINVCLLSAVGGEWAQGITTMGVNARTQAGTVAVGNLEISGRQNLSTATLYFKIPARPSFMPECAKAEIYIYRNGVLQGKVSYPFEKYPRTYPYEVSFPEHDGNFSFSVPEHHGSTVPAQRTLYNLNKLTVEINYQAPVQEMREINVELNYQGNQPSTGNPGFSLFEIGDDNIPKLVKSGDLHSGVNHLGKFEADTRGIKYQLKLTSFVDGETQYSPDQYEKTLMLNTQEDQKTVSAIYSGQVLAKTSLHIAVEDLPLGRRSQLTLKDDNADNTITQNVDHNGVYDISVPMNNKTWQVQASSIDNYMAKVTPASFVSDGEKKSINLSFKEQVNTLLTVGYLTSWNTRVTVSEAAEHGYNTVVLAFAKVNKDKVGMADPWYVYAKDWSKPEGNWSFYMKEDIEKAKASGKLKYVLLSVGGENNTFAPGDTDPNIVAKNIVDYAKSLDADGIDFDIENYGTGFGGNVTPEQAEEHLYQMIKAIKTLDPEFIVTAAPQLNLVDATHVNMVNSGVQQIYNKAVKAGLFNYLFIQEYNTGHYCINDQGEGFMCSGFTKENINQANPKFINNSFVRLKQIVPENTLIIPGQPSDKTAAGTASVYNGAYQANPYPEICQAYHTLANSHDSQYGGAMVWSINQDAANGYKFANSVFADRCAT